MCELHFNKDVILKSTQLQPGPGRCGRVAGSVVLRTNRLQVGLLVGVHTWVVGSVPGHVQAITNH